MAGIVTRPLEGIRVLDLTIALAGPYASLLFGGMGAEVIRIEAPGEGEVGRTNPPFVGPDGVHFGAKGAADVSLTTLNRGRNKKSITLDLKSRRGHELFMQLVKQADVVLENMSEGTAAKLKIDYESVSRVNPRIVYGSIKAFGEPSPYPELKGMDIIVQAMSGIMEVTGARDGPPMRWGLPMGDLLAPLYCTNGILAALIHRGRTGEGQEVKVSMLDCLASLVAEEHFDVFEEAGFAQRTGNFLDRITPFGVYETSDGHVAIAAFTPAWFEGLLDVIGQPQLARDPRYSTRGPRTKHAAELNATIEEWTRTQPSATVLRELLEKRGIPSARVRKPSEVLRDPTLHASGAVTRLSHPNFGDKPGPFGMGLPIQFSKTKSQFDQPAADLGSSNDEVLRGLLGLDDEQLRQLRLDKVI
jgi:crotonobetainyl-CoA:carnitine CoA-transferase CaiB-like acyl-CoA transferase